MPRSRDSNAATGDAVEEASASNPGGGAKTVSRCDIQHVCSGGVPASSRPVSCDRQLRAAELADLGALDAAAELERQQLHPVADAQHRDPELEQLGLQRRRAVGVDRRRAARQDHALGRGGARPPRHRRGGAAARRTRRTRARGARSAGSTGRRSRGRRPRRRPGGHLRARFLDGGPRAQTPREPPDPQPRKN